VKAFLHGIRMKPEGECETGFCPDIALRGKSREESAASRRKGVSYENQAGICKWKALAAQINSLPYTAPHRRFIRGEAALGSELI